MADRNHHTRGAPAPPVPDDTPEEFGPLAAFHSANTPEAAEQVRALYCPTCQLTPPDQRDETCHRARCHLRDPAAWRAERAWVEAVRHQARPTRELLETFNAHVAAAACATVAIELSEVDDRGGVAPTQTYSARTLRGHVHGALWLALSLHLGVMQANTREESIEAIAQRARTGQEIHAAWEAETVEQLRQRGNSDNLIGKTLGLDRHTLRNRYGKRSDWEERRRRGPAALGGTAKAPMGG